MAELSCETGLWLYAVVRDLDAHVVGTLPGVADAPVLGVAGEGLVAVVSPVPLAEFDEAALARNLEDLDWLAATTKAHDAVVSAVAGATATVPLRPATVYVCADGVRQLLAERGPELHATLDLLTGRTEWGVRAFADLPEGEQVAVANAERLHEAFAALAVATRRYPTPVRELPGGSGWLVLDSAYLVDDTRSAEVTATAERLCEQLPGIRVEHTAAWSPYSFAALRG